MSKIIIIAGTGSYVIVGCLKDCFLVDAFIFTIAFYEQKCIAGRRLKENFCVTWFSIHSVQLNELNIEHDVIVNYHYSFSLLDYR